MGADRPDPEGPAQPVRRPVDTMAPTRSGDLAESAPSIAPTVASAGGGRAMPASSAPALPDRYLDEGLLGVGGMGEVRQVRDTWLNRSVALKILHEELARGEEAVARFLEEAQVTAQLGHPGVVPVHDVGRLPDGRLYFTMKVVRGRTLHEVIRALHAASGPETWGSTEEGWTLRRLLDAFHRACEAIAYAHARRVVHRDLKPANIMVGPFGQVLVLDWGLGKILAAEEEERLELPRTWDGPPAEELGPVESDRSDIYATRAGVVGGTLQYMAPEQALALTDRLGPPADVWALGAVLHEILAGRPPYAVKSTQELFQAALSGPPGPPGPLVEGTARGPRTAGKPVPADLWELCCACLQFAVGERPADAGVVAEVLGGWLEGARRRAVAEQAVARARSLGPESTRLRAQATALASTAAEALSGLPPLAPIEARRPLWAQEDEARALARQADLVEIDLLQTLRGALEQAPDLAEAHAMLADHYQARQAAAEATGDLAEAARAQALLQAHDQGAHADWLRGEGRLGVWTDPPGAIVHLSRLEEVDRRLVPTPLRLLQAPLSPMRLPMGRYLVRLQHPSHAELRVPVEIGRLEEARLGSPEAPIPLPTELHEDEIGVPAGLAWLGGDPEANSPLPRQRVDVPAFVIQRHPVTNAQWLAFLNDLVDRGLEAQALRHAPRERGATPEDPGALVYGRDEAGRFHLAPDADGDTWAADWPVFLVDWDSAVAYADWWAARTGLPWRLPSEIEWEKAARGTDGRRYPWGEHREPMWAAVQDSHAGRMMPVSIHAFPTDESPYGVRGMAGGARDWCRELWTEAGPPLVDGALVIGALEAGGPEAVRVCRGGSWYSSPRDARAASRIRAGQALRGAGVSVRLVRSLPT